MAIEDLHNDDADLPRNILPKKEEKPVVLSQRAKKKVRHHGRLLHVLTYDSPQWQAAKLKREQQAANGVDEEQKAPAKKADEGDDSVKKKKKSGSAAAAHRILLKQKKLGLPVSPRGGEVKKAPTKKKTAFADEDEDPDQEEQQPKKKAAPVDPMAAHLLSLGIGKPEKRTEEDSDGEEEEDEEVTVAAGGGKKAKTETKKNKKPEEKKRKAASSIDALQGKKKEGAPSEGAPKEAAAAGGEEGGKKEPYKRPKKRSRQKNLKKDTRPEGEKPTYLTEGSVDYRPNARRPDSGAIKKKKENGVKNGAWEAGGGLGGSEGGGISMDTISDWA